MHILLTGANGYIGLRLLPSLLDQGHHVTCLVRDKRRFPMLDFEGKNISFCEADLLDPDSLQSIPRDIDAAFYLVHSMGSGSGKFPELESRCAANFATALEQTNASQVVYLSGIIPSGPESKTSSHLRSRAKVEEILRSGTVPLTTLRAPIIVGSGSASFEIIRDLVEKLPVMIAPKWLRTKCQPIAISNVITYLTGVICHPDTTGKSFDIGGPDVLTYRDMLLEYAKERNLTRFIIPVPVLTPRLSSYWLFFVTSTSFPLARALVDSMKHDVVCSENTIRDLVPQDLLTYRESINRAFDKIAQKHVPSNWFDALASGRLDNRYLERIRPPEHGVLTDKRTFPIADSPEDTTKRIWSIGGANGWYAYDWAWSVRGWLDRIAGGTGLRRGRGHQSNLITGDALDFWRVLVADRDHSRLLLYAEMKLPGEAWLEWKINDQNSLVQTATFRPNGLLGRIYWFAVLPFHHLIFRKMGEVIAGQTPVKTALPL
ncbi:MAG: SDR family oxidoreductase [Verrucomicrobiales bacterium]|nr:SDR family oxidoreductase [Verrucomicrobiales bacterium]